MFWSWSAVTEDCRTLLPTWTGVTSAVTTTLSDTVPGTSASFPRSRVAPASTLKLSTLIGLKPSSVTFREYTPGGTLANRNTPVSFEVFVRTAAVADSVSVTTAPGTTPPLSTTVPLTVLLPDACANASRAHTTKSIRATMPRTRARQGREPALEVALRISPPGGVRAVRRPARGTLMSREQRRDYR